MRTRGVGQGSASGTEFANRGKKKNGKRVCKLKSYLHYRKNRVRTH